DMRLNQTAAIAGTLAYGHDLGSGKSPQVLEPDLDGAVRTGAADLELPTRGVDFGNVGEMITHEERVVGRDDRTEIFDRRFVVGRAIAQLDERLLAGQHVKDRLRARPLGQQRREMRLALGKG